MDQGPLVADEVDAGAELVQAFDKAYPVKAAFWLKASDDELRYLYIASDSITDSNLGQAYREVLRLAHQMQTPYLDPFRVKLIGGNNPLAIAAAQKRSAGPFRTRVGGGIFGGTTVDEVFLYPASDHVAAN
jgi:hypothetical protein